MPVGKQSLSKPKTHHGNLASSTRQEGLMEAMIAACAYVAHADGQLDEKERQRVLHLMRAMSIFSDISAKAVIAAFARQERAFAIEPRIARKKVLDSIEALQVQEPEAHLIVCACQHVLEADGVRRLSEYQALHDIGRALGTCAVAVPRAAHG